MASNKVSNFPLKMFPVAVVFVITLMASCNFNRVYEKNKNITDDVWNHDEVLTFEVPVKDTLSPHNIYINIRNTGKYPRSNLFLFITTTSPMDYSVKDTFECVLANKEGRWLGKGFGNVWSHRIIYKKHVRFPFRGYYTFEIEQAMRIEKLPGITDAGIRIEKVKANH